MWPSFALEIGGMTAEEMGNALDREKINVAPYARSMLRNKEKFVNPVNKREKERKGETEILDLVRLRVRDLGFTSRPPTTTELFARAKEFGLDLCPPETGPFLRLADKDQSLGWCYIGMEPVTDSDGFPDVFSLARYGGELWLRSIWADPDYQWDLGIQFVFRVRKSDA